MPRFRPVLAALTAALTMLPGLAQAVSTTEAYGGRDMMVVVPSHLPPMGKRALVVVLHGGLGNASRIANSQSESALNMDAEAQKDGFIVVYLNGTPVTRMLGSNMLGWNAGGGCCGQSFANNIDDISYIQGAVHHLETEYGVDPARVFGMGHSNGAMMTQRLMCETTLYAAGVSISGPLNDPVSACPDARGKRILAIHGQNDANVPIAGGRGTKGISGVAYASEAHSRDVFIRSGAAYDLQVVPGADHVLENIDAAVQKSQGHSIQQEAARFFGLAAAN